MLGGVLVGILMVSASAIAYRAVQGLARAEPAASREPQAAATVAPAAVAPSPPQASASNDDRADDSDERRVMEPDAVAVAPSPHVSAAGELSRVPPAVASSVAATTSPQPPSSPIRAQPTEAELRAALSATPIVMYATSWCGVCRKAREFLSMNGFKYVEIDADTTPGGWDKVQRLGGRKAVPVIVVDGDVSVGLDTARVLSAAARSIERRLGVSGIRFGEPR